MKFSWTPPWKKETTARDRCYVISSLKDLVFFSLPQQNLENIKTLPSITAFSLQDLDSGKQKLQQWINIHQLQNAECH